ncbi:hypothetical protein G6F22_013135 [Rhizopus arrhizus]|nr:hypothetical protein G6F23_014915 [Rhizopus arrhizus]KAG0775659.1 hypothetical protein G6F22_013135 [Rhizopus arrhizus]
MRATSDCALAGWLNAPTCRYTVPVPPDGAWRTGAEPGAGPGSGSAVSATGVAATGAITGIEPVADAGSGAAGAPCEARRRISSCGMLSTTT